MYPPGNCWEDPNVPLVPPRWGTREPRSRCRGGGSRCPPPVGDWKPPSVLGRWLGGVGAAPPGVCDVGFQGPGGAGLTAGTCPGEGGGAGWVRPRCWHPGPGGGCPFVADTPPPRGARFCVSPPSPGPVLRSPRGGEAGGGRVQAGAVF